MDAIKIISCIEKGTKADALLKITKSIIEGIIIGVPIQQRIVEELSLILKVRRCIVFKFFPNLTEMYCQIIAGIPLGEHGIGLTDLLSNHPDVLEAYEKRTAIIRTEPRNDSKTAYFKRTIENKDIVQILYVPLKNEKKMKGLIVIDVTSNDQREKQFSEEEVRFCALVGELIVSLLEREEILIQRIQDEFRNRIVSLRGFALRMKKHTENLEKELDVILDDAKIVEDLIEKKYGTISF